MGAGVPYAIGAEFAHPDRPVIAPRRQRRMQMNNMAELITVQEYWKRGLDPRWMYACSTIMTSMKSRGNGV